ncbi:MAG: hypothetical protein IPM77_07985 [Crocinitomicaceae bacterium]|nr:hypothetical protein [Crocinitomicaceae bacterium]
MSAEDLNMDDGFRKAAGEIKFSYSKSFWKDAEKHLDDSSMDAAFLNAASVSAFMPDMNIADTISDAFMDEAFKSASQNMQVDFSSAHWSQFKNERSEIEQNVSFADAANSVIADYHPVYWTDADQALQNEGLHFEYKSSYWNDAKVLLDKSDRSVFFKRWSAVAAILLLFSAGGVYTSFNNESGDTSGKGNSTSVQPDYSDLTLPDQNSTDNTGKEDVLVDSDNYQIQNSDQSSTYQNTSELNSAAENDNEIESGSAQNLLTENNNTDITQEENVSDLSSELNSVADNNIEIESGASQNVLTESNSAEIIQEENISDLSSENNSSAENLTEQIIENVNVNQENLTENNEDHNAVSENQVITISETELNSQQITENINDENILVTNSDLQTFSSENSVKSEVNSELNEALIKLPGATSGFNPSNSTEYSGPKIEITSFRLKPTHTLSIYANAGVGNKYNAANSGQLSELILVSNTGDQGLEK